MQSLKTSSPAVLERRRLLQLAGAAATSLWLPKSAWSQPRLADNPFTLGIASGSPVADGFVLWTRLHPAPTGPVTLRWEVAHDENFTRIVQQGQAQALPELAHSVHVEVSGLAPDRWYFYRFHVGGAGNAWSSPIGRSRTWPLPDAAVARLRLAYASCQRWEHGYYAAYRHMLGEQVDAVVFLGDYIYEYPTAVNAVRSPSGGWTFTLDDYRQRYALHKTDPDLQAIHAACPWLVTWDDHEVQNDYAALVEGNAGPPVSNFAQRRAQAYQAFYEHMPLRASVLSRGLGGLGSEAEMRIYGQSRFGRLANIYLLDQRQYRSSQACTREGKFGSSLVDPSTCATWLDPKRTMLGEQQEAWLDAQLSADTSAWAVLGQSTLFGPRDFRAGPNQTFWNDGWDGYAPARQRLLSSLHKRHAKAERGTVLLGGDVHEHWVGHVKADYAKPSSATLAAEFCGTSISSRSAGLDRVVERLATNPHFVYADVQHRGYGVVEFTPKRMGATLRAVDDATRKDARLLTLAQFSFSAGGSALEQV